MIRIIHFVKLIEKLCTMSVYVFDPIMKDNGILIDTNFDMVDILDKLYK